jgi:CxxC motif-containing protein
MSETERYTCIGCPIGCPLQLIHEGNEITEISGHGCNRGAKYARQEFTDPRRDLSTTVAISGALWERLPVKVTGPILKDRVMEAAREIHALHISAPVKLGQVLIADFMGEKGVHVVACRSMERVS